MNRLITQDIIRQTNVLFLNIEKVFEKENQ